MSKDMSETEPKEHQLVSALTGACENGNVNTVKMLLDKGVPVDSFDEYGMTALMRASQRGHIDIVRLLLDRGAQIYVIGASTAALLSRINRIAPGRKDLIEKLQGRGAFTALILASGAGHTEVVRFLLDRNALIDAVDFNGWTALISASSYGHVEVVSLLIEKGAQVNFQSSDRSGTALIVASEGGHLNVVKLLLEKGADVNIYAKEGVTALMKATQHGHIDIVMLLLDKGAIVDFQQTKGATALMIACTLGHKNIVRALIDHGADMNKENGEGKSALSLAANRESNDITSVLQESGTDRDTRSQNTKKEEDRSRATTEETQSQAAFEESKRNQAELIDDKSESDTKENDKRDQVQAEFQSEDKYYDLEILISYRKLLPSLMHLTIPPHSNTTNPAQLDKPLDEQNLGEILWQLREQSSEWKRIGIGLGFREGELNNIEARPNNRTPEDFLRVMLSVWLQWAPGDCRGSTEYATLRALRRAVDRAGFGRTAETLSVVNVMH